jgi:hypothetical protein
MGSLCLWDGKENVERRNGPQQKSELKVVIHTITLTECQNISLGFFEKIFFPVVFLYEFLALS